MAECRGCGHDLAAGFCHACCRDFPLETISPDSRYCLGCYEFLLKEAGQLLPGSKRPYWLLRISPEPKLGPKKVIPVLQGVSAIMSTVEALKSEVDIIPPVTPKVALGKRGPKFKDLPADLITQLADDGMGSKGIATRLKEQDISVSYKTV